MYFQFKFIHKCIKKGAVIVTYDRHFANIDGLRIWHLLQPD
jgi:predicted nucleic acid-binding protein